jgi:crotonobetainyl-CoA:carnitine CoA-transferase CaiB-like acyl-CoA transferase
MLEKGPLTGLIVLDLSRVLAGPFCTQMLGDMGATIIKIERPNEGDDTRKWGPPFVKDSEGNDTSESAYYLSANRNKRSVAIDLSTPEGQQLIRDLAGKADILIENFKVGSLAKYGLDYQSLSKTHEKLIYCSITGFGQTGPLAHEPGYDFLAQALAGLMSVTGEPAGTPMKVGVALSDIMTGLYAAIGILSALQARHISGKGQHVDLALTDCTLSSLTNLAQYYLTAGQVPPRLGNAHASIVPYEAFETADDHVIFAVGNDTQFSRFAAICGHEEWAADPRFAKNSARVLHRNELLPLIRACLKGKTTAEWLALADTHNIPAAPIQKMDAVFETPQILARDMKIHMQHGLGEEIDLIGSPLKFSETPVSYRNAPPVCGADTDLILSDILGLDEATRKRYRDTGIIQ